jgi:hypothetical protein
MPYVEVTRTVRIRGHWVKSNIFTYTHPVWIIARYRYNVAFTFNLVQPYANVLIKLLDPIDSVLAPF